MTSANALTPLDPNDYTAIEAAVMETARGRWFLAEYAKRNRNADTDMLLGAIGRLEEAMVGERASQDLDRLRFDLMEMAKSISRTKSEIAALRPNGEGVTQLEEATEALDAIVRTTERATSEILESAETIQETAWTLRERGADDSLCDVLDRRATDIYTACSFQDLTAQRISKVVQVIRYLEGRINAMIDIWGGVDTSPAEQTASMHAHNADAPLSGIDMSLTQSDIDDVIVDEELFESSELDGTVYDTSPAFPRPMTDATMVHDGDVVFAEEAGTTTGKAHPAQAEIAPQDMATPDISMQDVMGMDAIDAGMADIVPMATLSVDVAGHPGATPDTGIMQDANESVVEDETTPDSRRRRAFAEIDAMSAAEKLRHFT